MNKPPVNLSLGVAVRAQKPIRSFADHLTFAIARVRAFLRVVGDVEPANNNKSSHEMKRRIHHFIGIFGETSKERRRVPHGLLFLRQ